MHEPGEVVGTVRQLIKEVSLRPVLYDPHNPSYKDSNARLNAWQSISRRMRIPVTDCQVKWGTLRRCLANARKRQMRRKESGSKSIKKWRYQDEMDFLTPYIDRKDYDYIVLPNRNRKSINEMEFEESVQFVTEEYENDEPNTGDDDSYDVKPELITVEDDCIHGQEPEQSTSITHDMCIEVDDEIDGDEDEAEVEGYTLNANEWMKLTEETKNEDASSSRDVRPDTMLDDMDTFFLSMARALKKLPLFEQIKARSQVYSVVTRTEMSWLNKSKTSSTEDVNSK